MATIEIVVDDRVLSDFYAGSGAVPDPAWSSEEQETWLKVMVLEPFINRCLLKRVSLISRLRSNQAASALLLEEQVVLESGVEATRLEREQSLPEKLRPTKPDSTPIKAQRQ